MKPLTKASLGSLTSAVLLVLATGDASAQPAGTPPRRSPAVSPWLEMSGTRGNDATFRLYERVQPRLNFQNSINNLQQQLRVTQSAVTGLEQTSAAAMTGTGHATYFMNLGGYFQSSGPGASSAAGARPQAGTGQAPQRAGGSRTGAINAASGGRLSR